MISMPTIGNAIMWIASIIMVVSGLPKNKKTILWLQTIQIGLMALGNLLLGSLPGAISNGFGIVRNFLNYFDKLKLPQKICLVTISTIFALIFNNIGGFVIFPITAAGLFAIFMTTKSVAKYKLLCIIASILWMVHDIYIKSYVTVFFDILTITSNIIGIYRTLPVKAHTN